MDTTRFEVDESGTARLNTSKGVLMMDAADLQILQQPCQIKIKRDPSGHAVYRADVWTTAKPHKRIGFLSRLIMNAPFGMVVDHINHDTLDNRRCNMRVCTHSENCRNRMKNAQSKGRFKCVGYHHAKKYNQNASEAKPWRAYTTVHGKRIWLGYHATEEAAAAAYDQYAIKTFGDFACLNTMKPLPVKVPLEGSALG